MSDLVLAAGAMVAAALPAILILYATLLRIERKLDRLAQNWEVLTSPEPTPKEPQPPSEDIASITRARMGATQELTCTHWYEEDEKLWAMEQAEQEALARHREL